MSCCCRRLLRWTVVLVVVVLVEVAVGEPVVLDGDLGADAVRGRGRAGAVVGADTVAIGRSCDDVGVGVGLDVGADGGDLAVAAPSGHALDLEAGLVGWSVTPSQRDGSGESAWSGGQGSIASSTRPAAP